MSRYGLFLNFHEDYNQVFPNNSYMQPSNQAVSSKVGKEGSSGWWGKGSGTQPHLSFCD